MLSPKSHKRFVIVPVEVSLNETLSGALPLVGLAVKAAAGPAAAVPMSALVLFPPLLANAMTLLKLPPEPGANFTVRFVELNAGMVKEAPETTVNGPLP